LQAELEGKKLNQMFLQQQLPSCKQKNTDLPAAAATANLSKKLQMYLLLVSLLGVNNFSRKAVFDEVCNTVKQDYL